MSNHKRRSNSYNLKLPESTAETTSIVITSSDKGDTITSQTTTTTSEIVDQTENSPDSPLPFTSVFWIIIGMFSLIILRKFKKFELL